jgi:hypothetical protein
VVFSSISLAQVVSCVKNSRYGSRRGDELRKHLLWVSILVDGRSLVLFAVALHRRMRRVSLP